MEWEHLGGFRLLIAPEPKLHCTLLVKSGGNSLSFFLGMKLENIAVEMGLMVAKAEWQLSVTRAKIHMVITVGIRVKVVIRKVLPAKNLGNSYWVNGRPQTEIERQLTQIFYNALDLTNIAA